jgi:hypothetical protein
LKELSNELQISQIIIIFMIEKVQITQLKRLRRGYWKDLKNRKTFLETVGVKAGVKTPEDWYNITARDVINVPGGSSFLKLYNSSHINAIKELLSEYQFEDFLFTRKAKNYWRSAENKKSFLEYIYKKYNFKTLDDFYNINYQLIRENNGKSLLNNSSLFFLFLFFSYY